MEESAPERRARAVPDLEMAARIRLLVRAGLRALDWESTEGSGASSIWMLAGSDVAVKHGSASIMASARCCSKQMPETL